MADVIVVGGGVNGLACAAMLARGGARVTVVERRGEVGGCAAEHELAPGFRVPRLAHATGPVGRDLVEALRLTECGLRFSDSLIQVCSLSPDGRPLIVSRDAARTADGLRAWSMTDAERWPAFARSLSRVAGVVASLFARTPPPVDDPGAYDFWTALRTFGAFRGLARDDQWRLLRWGPMAAADLVAEACDTELLRATLAADGTFGAMLGPWSAGSGLLMLLAAANRSLAPDGGRDVAGGPAAFARALAESATRAGVELRAGHAVARIDVTDGRASGVTLENGDRIGARTVVSGLDPKRTLLSLTDAAHLPPEVRWRVGNFRTRGTVAKLNLALSALPAFAGATPEMLASRVRLAPDIDYIERAFDHAKYGRISPEPWVEFTIPSLGDPSLAPAGAHVLSAYVQFVPYGREPGAGDGGLETERKAVGDAALAVLERYAPGLRALVVASEVVTPRGLEADWGLTGGHIFHGELALDQLFSMRPLLGWANYRTPIPGLYLCGSGTHPGTGLTGGSGLTAAREIARALKSSN